MITLYNKDVFWEAGKPSIKSETAGKSCASTIAESILRAHSESGGELKIKFDALISHDITYVGVVQTAIASGISRFPVPYVLTNCHNSLCAVGGTINEDDHVFGLSAAKRFGGIYVPANLAVIHQYAREELSGCGRMILGSDSHTRFGALGTMGVGEGGAELVKQLLGETWDAPCPETILVYLTGEPARGVGPHDVALALCGAVYKNNFVKNKILEFAGPGIKNLSADYRIGIDVMTTETACLSSIWQTDEVIEEFYAVHGRPEAYRRLEPEEGARYDGLIEIDLSKIEPMAALPYHPSEAYTIRELKENGTDILASHGLSSKLSDGRITVDQGIIAGCAGGMYDNVAEAAEILKGTGTGSGYFSMSVYPSSMPVSMELIKNGVQTELMQSGAVFKPCFCGPCFGAGDVPANGALSARHTTRNFPSREGSRPADGQHAFVMLMDARSIAATARNGGVLTAATEIDYSYTSPSRVYDRSVYDVRVYNGFGKPDENEQLRYGPNILPWPEIPAMPENLYIVLASVIHDPVTTTDELIPSGEISSYRSNPHKLAEFTLSRRDPEYVARAKKIKDMSIPEVLPENTGVCSVIYAEKPGDGSAREQAASCQRVLGGGANIAKEYATKRYRSNCINWGLVPFTIDLDEPFDYSPGDGIFVPGIREAIEDGKESVKAKLFSEKGEKEITLWFSELTSDDRETLLAGCLMNKYRMRNKK